MPKPKTAKPKTRDEDPEESKRFLALVADLEAAGDLSSAEGEKAFERLVDKALPKRSKPSG